MQEQVLQEQEKAGDATNAKKVEDDEKTQEENEHSLENGSTGCYSSSIVMTYICFK